MDMSDYYSGAMTPPTMSDYNAIIGMPGATGTARSLVPSVPSTGLTTRTVNTVPVPMQVVTNAGVGLATGGRGAGSLTYQAPPAQRIANPIPTVRDLGSPQYGIPGSGGGVLTKTGLPPGSTVEKTYTQRVPSQLPAIAGGYGKAGASGFGSGALTAVPPAAPKAPAVITLASEPMSEISGQNTANSFGKPVRGPSGKTYYPSNTPMSGVRAPYAPVNNVTGSMSAKDNRGPLGRALGLKTGGLGGLGPMLFGGLFGGGAQPAAALGGGSSVSPGLGYNAAYSQTPTGDGQGNNAFSSSDGRWGGARSLTE